ncbi:Holliday junction branch migration protein RuvA [Corynebacterium breve]|uniref:Holliday junction branch migration complex subunit RuvA n=1 Tax=Corynebacterium breve TaxID=3049799 RepID=A0ABY8VHY6_9CORY|nr:Holliday junction branch migration protein RuvA [Corynebacterium breve]WIM68952.1 Holliday junction branch migration protein RuvA [Corynebacterium breve]
MIDSLNGEVVSIGLDHGVIECGGVGYRFLATPPTLARLVRGEKTRVLTSMVVKEDAMTLYGFIDDDARMMFHRLQSVSGLGPKLALASLAVFSAGEIAGHITNEDAKALQAIPGVGKRMAERMVVELKDKLKDMVAAKSESTQPAADVPAGAGAVVEQVVEALVGLGFTDKAARPAVEAIVAEQPDLETAALLRSALTQLGRN